MFKTANLNLIAFILSITVLLFFPMTVKGQCSVVAQKDTSLCTINTPIHLSALATDALGYKWFPKTGLNDSSIASPVAITNATQQYIVTAVVPDNTELVTNGDFESGNTGFSSNYVYKASTTVLREGEYTLNSNPSNIHPCFANCKDKSGTGKMMILNGASTTNVAVWKQTITIQPNTDYAFSAWLQNVTCGAGGFNAVLQFSINSTLIGNIFSSDSNLCVWKQFYQVWNSGSSTSATISIVNQYTSADGNDFALDNISFKKFCTAKDTVTITVAILTGSDTIQICTGDSVLLGGKYRKTPGIYNDTITTAAGCDSIATVTLQTGFISISVDTSICSTDSIFLQGQYRKNPGIYTDTLSVNPGCDSIRTTTLNIMGYTLTIDTTICSQDSLFLQGRYRKTGGTYYDTLISHGGCDSIITTHMQLLYYNTLVNKSICTQDSILLQGKYRKVSGIYYDTLTSLKGCDSVVTTNLTVSNNIIIVIDTVICPTDSVLVNGHYYKSAGTYSDTISTVNGCDTILTTNLFTSTTTFTSQDVRLCGTDSFYFDNTYLKVTGTYYDTIYKNNCPDTIKTLNLAVNPFPLSTILLKYCINDSILFNGLFYKTDTVFYDTIANAPNCDSIIIITIKEVGQTPAISDSVYYCDAPFPIINVGNYPIALWSEGTTGQYFEANTEGLFWVQVKDTNGCAFNDTIDVIERCDPVVFIPSSFSPNNDGKNDFLIFNAHNVDYITFRIFDRWGEIVFETTDKNIAWNGIYKGEPLPIGIYFWQVSYGGKNMDSRIIKKNENGILYIIH